MPDRDVRKRSSGRDGLHPAFPTREIPPHAEWNNLKEKQNLEPLQKQESGSMSIKVKQADECAYDALSLGEIMLRLDPGEGRIHTARSFKAWEGGGEYNVVRGLRRCFGLRTAVVTAFADNPVGRLIEDFILQGGVDASLVRWVPFDGVGRSVRNGLNFTERGFGIRGALGCSDRGHTAASQMKKGDVDWERIFNKLGVRWFHTGGIFAALSETTPEAIIEAMREAKKNGTVVSYDLNYRSSLWKSIGGKAKARVVNREIAKYVDVMIGNEEDFTACLGFEVEGVDENLSELDAGLFKRMIEKAVKTYPNFKAVATTLRAVKTATVNDWGAVCWMDGRFHQSRHYPGLEILDRVGGGDSFASGFIYGLVTTGDPQKSVDYGAAHGALAMTTPGDTSMATLDEVEKVASGGSARVVR
jgi:2-dehydro-3-deoxygluconokinase